MLSITGMLWLSHLTDLRENVMSFESLVNQKLPEDIVRNLLLMIEEKKLRPGEKLPLFSRQTFSCMILSPRLHAI